MRNFKKNSILNSVLTSFTLVLGLMFFGMEQVNAQCYSATVNRHAAAYHSNLYLAPNGSTSNTLLAWGASAGTMTGGVTGDYCVPTVVSSSNYSGIPIEVRGSSAGSGATNIYLLRTTTNLYLFGANFADVSSQTNFGAASLTSTNANLTSKLPNTITIDSIYSVQLSPSNMAIITKGGLVYMNGSISATSNIYYKLGDSSTSTSTYGNGWHKVLLPNGNPLIGIKKLSMSDAGSFALKNDGSIYYWGKNVLANSNNTSVDCARARLINKLPIGKTIADVLCLGKATDATTVPTTLYLLTSDGYVYSCGSNVKGELGTSVATTALQSSFVPVMDATTTNPLSNIIKIDGSTESSSKPIRSVGALNSTGKLFTWGDNSAPMIGGDSTLYVRPHTYNGTDTAYANDFTIGGHFTVIFDNKNNKYWYLGHYTVGSMGSGDCAGDSFYKIWFGVSNNAGYSFACSNSAPSITVNGSFSAFSACANVASNTQSITISGAYLSDNITVTAPSGFEVSTSPGSGFASAATLTQSGGDVLSTAIYVRVTSSASGSVSGVLTCTSMNAASKTFTLTGTVNTLPIISSVTGATRTGTGTLTISGNTATSGATIDWYQNSTSGTALASGVNSTTSYTTPSISTTTNYFAQARNLTTGCISATRSITSATINGSFSAGVVGTDQTICYGKSPSGLTSISDASGGTGVISYQWQLSTTSSSTGFTNISGQTLSTYTPDALTASTWFRRAAVTTLDGTIYSAAIAITVNSLPTASAAVDNSRTGAGPVIIGATASAGATLDWYAASTSGTVLTGGNGVTTYTTPSISLTTTYFAEARTTTAPGCISSSRIPVLATINGSFSPGSVGANQTICSGNTPVSLTSITDASGGTGSISYTWLISTTSVSSGFYTATGTYNATTYTPSGVLTQTTYYKRTAKTTTTADGTIESNVITVTVNALPSTPTGVNGSRYGTGTVNISASVNTGETVDWYAASTGGSVLSGGTGTTSFITPSISTTTNYYAQARNATTGCLSTARATVTASINTAASLTVNGTLTPFTACSGVASSTQTITVAGSSLTTNITLSALTGYEYSLSSGSGFANSLILNQSSGSVATTTIYVRLSSTATNAAGGNIVISTTGASDVNVATGSATINIAPSITVQPSTLTQTLVQNTNATTLSVTATGSNLTYQWYSNTSSSTSGATSILNATHASYIPLTGTVGTLYYYVIVSGTCTPAVTSAVSGSIVVSASTTPVIGHVGDLTPFSECTGSASAAQTFTISGSSLTSDIVVNTLTGYEFSTDGTTYSNTITLTQSGGTVASTTVYVRLASGASAGAGGNITLTSTSATDHLIPTGSAIINTAPAITSHPSSSTQTLSQNASATALTISATGSNLTYQWFSNSSNTNSGGTLLTGATSATYTPSTATISTLYYYVVVSGTCSTITSNISGLITINGAASILTNDSFTAFTTCAGTASVAQNFTVSGSNLTSAISIASLTGFEYATTIGGSYTSILTLNASGGVVTTTTVYVRLSSLAANGAGGDIIISATGATDKLVNTGAATVKALPNIVTQPSTTGETLIKNSTSGNYSISATGTDLTYQWYSNVSNSNSSGTLISGETSNTFRPSTATIGTLYYYVVVTNTCSTVTSNITGAIVVITEPVITLTGTLTTFNSSCAGTVSAEQIFTVEGADLTDDILISAPSGYEISKTSGTGFASSVILLNTTGTISSTTIYIRLTNTANNGDGGNVTVTSLNATQQNITTGTASVTTNTISLSSATGTDDQTVVQNANIINITYATTGATGASFSGLPSGVSGAWVTNEITISGAPTIITNATYTITLTGGCGAITASGSIISNNPSLGNSTIIVTGLTTYTYSGLAQGPITSNVTGSTSTPNYSYSGTGSTSYGPSSTPPTAIGTYQVIASVAGDANYNGANSVAYLFTIEEANSSLGNSTIVVTGLTSFTYNASSQGPNASTVLGSNGAITYSYVGTSGTTYGPSSIAPKLPGSYQVIATVAANSSYNGATSAAYPFIIIQSILTPTVGNARYILNQNGLPSNIGGLIKTYPTGTIPAWCNVLTSICSTTPPTLPTEIGKYVYQVRAYDTTTLKYSDNFINDTLIIAPPVPKVIDSTFVIGVITNPSNVGVQVTGMSGAVLNYYFANTRLSNVPSIGTIATVKKYILSQTVNNIESDTTSFTTTTLDPNSIIHLQKIVDSGILQVNSTFNYPFTLVLTNLTKYPFSNVVLTDNLQNFVPISSEYSIVKNTATGGLVANNSYNGNNDINLTSNTSTLGAFTKDTVKFVMNLIPKGYTGTISNIAYVKADTKWGTIIMQSSTNSSNELNTKNSTNYFVKDLRIYIPEGFSPNHDGSHDKLVIIKPFGVTLNIQIFNRWGNVVYTNSNYQNDWDGKGTGNFAGKDLIEGGYYYSLRAVDENGKVEVLKGSLILQR